MLNIQHMKTQNEHELNLFYIATVCGDDTKEAKKFKRFGNGLFAAYSSFAFFCQAHGLTWGNKAEREPLESKWNTFREENQSKVADVSAYHFKSVTERKTYSDTKGVLTSHKRLNYVKVLSQKDTADYLEDRSKTIRNVISGKMEKVVGAELQNA